MLQEEEKKDNQKDNQDLVKKVNITAEFKQKLADLFSLKQKNELSPVLKNMLDNIQNHSLLQIMREIVNIAEEYLADNKKSMFKFMHNNDAIATKLTELKDYLTENYTAEQQEFYLCDTIVKNCKNIKSSALMPKIFSCLRCYDRWQQADLKDDKIIDFLEKRRQELLSFINEQQNRKMGASNK